MMTLAEHQAKIESRISLGLGLNDSTIEQALWVALETLKEIDGLKWQVRELKTQIQELSYAANSRNIR